MKRPKEFIDIEYKRRAVEHWQSGKKGKRRFSSVQKKFRRVKNVAILYEWKKQLENGGSHNDKYLKIWEFVLDQFRLAKETQIIVHDDNLRNWAVAKARELGLESFTASTGWLAKFKSTNRIVSRKGVLVFK